MDQITLSKKINKSQAFISMFFNDQTGCSWATAKKLSAVLGQSPAFWMDAASKEKWAVYAAQKQGPSGLAAN